MDLIKALNEKQLKEVPQILVGDTVRVHVKVKEGARERVQVFEGTVIAKKHGGIEETITVRRLSYGVGVEKVFPVHSAAPSCTTCVTASVRQPRFARSCKHRSKREHPRKWVLFFFLRVWYTGSKAKKVTICRSTI